MDVGGFLNPHAAVKSIKNINDPKTRVIFVSKS
jgi:hypothetical protein